jgi:hypothetical protein
MEDNTQGMPGDYFSNVSKSDMMRVVLALATEVYAMRDRQNVLEEILSGCDIDLARLDEQVEAAVYDVNRLAERDAFVARVFAAMAGPAR